MADSKIFPHSYNTLIGFDVADEQMNSMNKCDVGPPYANGLFLYTQKTSENLSSLVFSVSSPPLRENVKTLINLLKIYGHRIKEQNTTI